MSEVYDETACQLGEGPLWHPEREQLYWFDILGARLHTREDGRARSVQFDELVSAAGWVSDTELLIASETRLFLHDVERERSEDVEGLEAGDPETRSNDGRADPWGGFWIGTMGKRKGRGAGAIYRYYRGELRRLYPDIAIPNSICFLPNQEGAFFADTPTGKIMRQGLDPDHGWPDGDPEVFLDLTADGLHPDGSVVDAAGNLWNAQWGAWRVACYGADGDFLKAVEFDAAHTSCPAFGGPGLSTLYCTTAREDLSEASKARSDSHGMTFAEAEAGIGQAEHRILL